MISFLNILYIQYFKGGKTMIFDGHSDIINDVANKIAKGKGNVFESFHYNNLKNSGVFGAVFTMWVEPEYYNKSLQRLHALMYIYKNCIASNPNVVTVTNSNLLSNEHKLHIILGLEGMSAIEDDISQIELLYDFGVRHGMLTWNHQNFLASGALAPEVSGLTNNGKRAVKLMQELGMVVDVSHLNDKSFYDVVNITTAPIIASHSNCRSLCNNKRNLTDEQIKLIADTGGIIGVNAYGDFVGQNQSDRTVHRLAEHIVHIIEVAGVEHVGFGFDFCDFLEKDNSNFPYTKGLENINNVNNLINSLIELGVNNNDIEKIKYKNFYRVIKQVLK